MADVSSHVDWSEIAARRTRIRIEWRIGEHLAGHGDWFGLRDEETLREWVDDRNRRHGANTHWLKYDDSQGSL